MKPVLCGILILSAFGPVAGRAADGPLRAAVVTETTDASLKGGKLGVRQHLESGCVFEVASSSGLLPELKIDAERVVVVNPRYLKMRVCTPAELAEAQAKFNNQDFEAERSKIEEAYRKALAKAREGLCATCPKARAAAAQRENEARKTRHNKLNELNERKQALLAEALAWASAK